MTSVVTASLGLVVGGPIGAALGAAVPTLVKRFESRAEPEPSTTLVLLLLLIELRSGLSALAALIEVANSLPGYRNLGVVARVARVSGFVAALGHADDRVRPIVAQLSRAQRSGASLSGTVMRMLESALAEERARRIARARALPVKLMIPVTLLMLPGMVLFIYAPSLLSMFSDLTGVFS